MMCSLHSCVVSRHLPPNEPASCPIHLLISKGIYAEFLKILRTDRFGTSQKQLRRHALARRGPLVCAALGYSSPSFKISNRAVPSLMRLTITPFFGSEFLMASRNCFGLDTARPFILVMMSPGLI